MIEALLFGLCFYGIVFVAPAVAWLAGRWIGKEKK